VDEGLSLKNLAFVMLPNSVNDSFTSLILSIQTLASLFYLNYPISASGIIRIVVSPVQLIVPAVLSSIGDKT
jgi:hypothetical protein